MSADDPPFDGPDYDPELDHVRLRKQHERIRNLMLDGTWRTLAEIAEFTEDPEASISAQLRHLRKKRFGSFCLEKQRRGEAEHGLWEYRLLKPGPNSNESPTEVNDRRKPMAMIRLDSFSGTAEILGATKNVSFDRDAGLTIYRITLAEANQLLGVLATGKLSGVQLTGEGAAARDVLSTPGGDAEEPTQASKRGKGSKPAKPPETAQTAPTAPADPEESEGSPSPGQEETAAEAAGEGEGNESPEPTKEDKPKRGGRGKGKGKDKPAKEAKASSNGAEKPTNGKGAVSDELLEELQGQKRLRGVLGILVDNGFKTHKDLVDICKKLESNVPVLDRCANLDERVPRIASSIGIEK